jgi:isopenicillin N synthase-like dioxygenase
VSIVYCVVDERMCGCFVVSLDRTLMGHGIRVTRTRGSKDPPCWRRIVAGKDKSLEFMRKAQGVSENLMLCFARGLGFSDDYFIRAHDISRPESQTVLRLLHYFSVDSTLPIPEGYYRASEHVDWDFITLLFQRAGQSGLEIWKSFIDNVEILDNDMRH